MTVREVIAAHPRQPAVDREVLLRCIEECYDCAATCTGCADACLGETDLPDLVRCVRLCLDCADACEATGRVLTRLTEADPRVLGAMAEACATACGACAEECERHAHHHEHCRISAELCRSCERACNDVLAALG